MIQLLILGAAFTRLQTLRLQKVFPQTLADKLISYGSCQFPTLGFVVERYQAIENFIDEPFWRIKGKRFILIYFAVMTFYHDNQNLLLDCNQKCVLMNNIYLFCNNQE